MRIAIGVGGEVTGTPMSPQDIVDDVVAAEAIHIVSDDVLTWNQTAHALVAARTV